METNWNSFVVAMHDKDLAGMIHWHGEFIHVLHIAPALWRRGIGTKLLRRAEEDMTRNGIARARVETDTFNLPAQRFYTARGYTEKDRYPDKEWDSGLTTILFEKDLKPVD